MKRLLLLILVLFPGLLLAQFPYGHGNFIISTTDTVNIDKTSNYFYYYSTDGKLYFSKGGHLVNVGASDGDLEVSGAITGSQINATGATGTSFYGETPNTTDAVLHLKRTDGAEVKLGASSTHGYVGTTTSHAFMIQTNNTSRLGLNAGGTSFTPNTTGTLYLGSTDQGFRGLFIDGKKSTSNLIEIGNDADGSMGDSSIYVTSAANMVFPNNKWLQWKNAAGTPTNVFKWSNGDAVTFNSAALYLLPDVTATMDLGSTALGFKGLFIEGKKRATNSVEIVNDKDGAVGDSSITITPTGAITQNGVTRFMIRVALADEGEYTLPASVAGFGKVYCDAEYATFTFTNAAVVSLVTAGTAGLTSANVTTTNGTDEKLNIYDGGSAVIVENQLGDTFAVMIIVEYYTQ